jgi:cellulose synthase/poly-beta-1,6-N-acetylglucosamine synthase-like glycosyltransferase
LARKLHDHEFDLDDTPVRLTPAIGFVETTAGVAVDELEDRAWDAVAYQANQRDMHPTKWVAAMSGPSSAPTRLGRALERYRTTLQVAAQQLVAVALPFLTYWMLDTAGFDITGVVYLALVVALGVTATMIWGESHTALAPTEPPPPPPGTPPRASAIIAAYLPNEAATVVETVAAFLAQDYPHLQVILAYNTPTRLEVEDELRAIAATDPRFLPLRVDGSVSKAQNVNAALAHVTGEFVGLFDADHHPTPGSFHRAWRWIAGGAGVVQGHCVIRNGDTNLVTRLVAVEFEAIYAVSHPGRARLHGFGVFGGSNGYWRTDLLRRTRMRGAMLTEDIDSSMRVVQSGETIISDPDLISTELAPDTPGALWNQRLRWAQGWSQVSLRHLATMVRRLPRARQRLGAAYLLGWREVYPWVSLQMFPLLAYWWFKGEPAVDWFVPIFVFTTLVTLSAGPLQVWYAWRLAHPSVKERRGWFVLFLVVSLLIYTELKNVVARTAHVKELMRERKWKVTPRTGSVAFDAEAAQTPLESAAIAEPATTEPTPAVAAAAIAEADAPARAPRPRRRVPRTRRHGLPSVRRTAPYDHEQEAAASSIYDHEREHDAGPTRPPTRPPATTRAADAPRPNVLASGRPYEPDFLQQLVGTAHRHLDLDVGDPRDDEQDPTTVDSPPVRTPVGRR